MAELFQVKTDEEAEAFLSLAFNAYTDAFDGMKPENLEESLKSGYNKGAIETVARVIAFGLAGTTVCPEGLGIGDVVTMIEADLTDAARLVVHGSLRNADNLCNEAAKRFMRIIRGEEDFVQR